MTQRIAIVLLMLCLSVSGAAAQDFESVFGNIKAGVKICSAVSSGNWRDDLMVPMSWSIDECRDWAKFVVLADSFNWGCMTEHVVQYNSTPGWLNPCHW
jgi:hypothetical protein